MIQRISSTAVTEPLPSQAAIPQSDSTDLQDPTFNLPGADIWLHTPQTAGKRGAVGLVVWLTLLSLGIHGLLLLLPVAPEKPADPPPSEKEKAARITQLSPSGSKGANVINKPKPEAKAATPLAKPRSSNRPPAVPPIPPVQPPPTPAAAKTPASAATTPVDPAATPPAIVPTTAEPMAGNPWEDFPQYPQSQPGCYNLDSCRQATQPLGDFSLD